MIERDIQSLLDVPGLVRKQEADQVLDKVRRVRGSNRDTRGREGLTDAELNKYLIDDQDLLWLECERVGVLTRTTSVLVILSCLVSYVLALVHCQHGHLGVTRTVSLLGTHSTGRACVEMLANMSYHAVADVGNRHVASV